MKRRALALLFLPALLIALVAIALGWVLNTGSGARWLWSMVGNATGGALTADELSGDLRSGLRIEGMAYRIEGLDAGVRSVRLQLDLDLLPPSLSFGFIEAEAVEVRTTERPQRPDGRPPAELLESLALPVPLEFEQVRISGLRVAGADGEQGFAADELSLAAHWYRRLEISRLTAKLGENELYMEAGLGLAHPFPLAVDGTGSLHAALAAGMPDPLRLKARVRGDLGRLRLDLAADEPPLRVTGELADLLQTPRWDLELSSERLGYPLDAGDPSIVIRDLVFASYGSMQSFGLEANAMLQGPDIPPTEARLLATGSGEGIRFEMLHISNDELTMDGEGEAMWDPEPRIEAELAVSRLGLHSRIPGWPETLEVGGRLELQWQDELIELMNLELSAPGALESLQGTAAVDLGDGRLSADFSWDQLRWPPGAGPPELLSREGSAHLEGNLEEWTISGDLGLAAAGFPEGRLRLAGRGGAERFIAKLERSEVLGGELAGSLQLDWSGEPRWLAELQLARLATAPLLPSYPGTVSGALVARGGEDGRISVEDIDLSGQIRERPVRLSGALDIAAGHLSARGLELRSGSSHATLDGDIATPAGLGFSADIAALSDLTDGLKGRISGSGRLSIDPARPRLELRLEGEGLDWGGGSIERLSAGPLQGPDDTGRTAVMISGMVLAGQVIESLTLRDEGGQPLERIAVEIHAAGVRTEMSLAGRIADWGSPLDPGWSGRLETLRLETDPDGLVQLEAPVPITVSQSGIRLSLACLRHARQGRACTQLDWQADGAAEIELSLHDVAAESLASALDSELSLSQRVTGRLMFQRQDSDSEPSAEADLEISPGRIFFEESPQGGVATGKGRFGFVIRDGRLHSGQFDVPLAGSGGIDTDFSIPDLSAGLRSPAQGRLRIQLDDIAPLMQLFSGLQGSSGPVSADLLIGGTLQDPEISGSASLVKGRISHDASGLLLEDIRLEGAMERVDQAELIGTFRAGEGRGRIRLSLDLEEPLSPALRIQLNGERLTVVNVPDIQVIAEPDLGLEWREGMLAIDGRVRIPSARLTPRYLPAATTSESEDVVIVAGEELLSRPRSEEVAERSISGSLEVELGDDILINLERATARLGGSATFSWQEALMPMADGRFLVTGEINAYGQLLTVTDGRISYSNQPANNPNLNISAEREIFGNSQVRRAGILVTGTLRRPVTEAYTIPMTNRDRALTLLVTGSDFDFEQGLGSFEVGTYIAPRLYLSYGIGLFENQNVISARYDLGRGFGVKVTSGQRETGADITYTVDR
jgi:translocation and assembly module TamB